MDWFDIVSFVNTTVTSVVNYFLGWVNFLLAGLNALAAALHTIGTGSSAFSNSLFGSIGKFFENFWNHFIKRAILGLLKLWENIRDRLARLLGPLLRWLQRIRQWFDTHVLPILLRYINLIQRIRRFLVVLRLLHIHWADALDSQLAKIQGKLTAVIEVVRGTLNQIISTLALVMDPSLIIRRNILGASLLSHLGAVKRIVGYGDNRILTADEAKEIDRDANRYKAATVTAHVTQLAASGLTDEDKAEREAARRALVEAFDTALPF
jgi:hypothetical protein